MSIREALKKPKPRPAVGEGATAKKNLIREALSEHR
jgi:hypothetical protein